MRRRTFVGAAAAAAAVPSFGLSQTKEAPAAEPRSLREIVIERARALSERAFERPASPMPAFFQELDYDAYRQIAFRNELGIWRDGPTGFELQPLHRGWYYDDRVTVRVVEDGVVSTLAYDPGLFGFGTLGRPGADVEDIGYSGIRLLAPVEEPGVAREFAVFQGASYFRAVARGLVYGLSARGIAVNTGEPEGEEFPAFTELWVEAPAPGADGIVVHALLDGPSVTGAYRFRIAPSLGDRATTQMDVEAALFPRVDLEHVGLAPLTSMFWFSALERPEADDYRPRVHDSDGLAIFTGGGQWVWRPLSNPERLQISSFDPGEGGRVRGFGLAQRARAWDDFEDIEGGYHRRPTGWVEPGEHWPEGRVELFEIPTDDEFNDNIVAFWRPNEPPRAGSRFDVSYRLGWSGGHASGFGLLAASRSASGAHIESGRLFVIDFSPQGAEGGALPTDPADLEAVVGASQGTVSEVTLTGHPTDPGFRLSFRLEPEGDVAEIRASVQQAGRPISETWLYRWTSR